MNKKDIKRLEELKVWVWRNYAAKLFDGKPNADTIYDTDIEKHRGRRSKAIRLLSEAGIVSFKEHVNDKYHDKFLYEIHSLEESKGFTVPPNFIHDWKSFHQQIFCRDIYDDQQSFDTIGYIPIHDLGHKELLYVYWHQDEYDIIKYERYLLIYAKELLETRMLAMSRAIVEQHFQDDFSHKLERYLGLPENSLKQEPAFSVEIRNFSAYAFRFTKEAFFGDKGFLEEYSHYGKYFEALIKNLQDLHNQVEKAGGFKVIIKNMRENSIQQLIGNAPLNIRNETSDTGIYRYDNINFVRNRFKNPFLNTFILKNAAYFNYETLYGEDDSIGTIDERGSTSNFNETPFTPNDDELQVIAKMEREKTTCLAKAISEILQPT